MELETRNVYQCAEKTERNFSITDGPNGERLAGEKGMLDKVVKVNKFLDARPIGLRVRAG